MQAQVDAVQEGSGLADLVDDLDKLAALVKRQAGSLGKARLARAAERTEAALSDALGLEEEPSCSAAAL